jgi:anti-sigma factor RsiW
MSLCESIDTLAMAYLDDELASEERRELETHLTECTACRGEVETARGDQSLIQSSLAAPRATDTMRMRLARSFDEADREAARAERRRMSSWLLPGSAIAAAAAAIAVFVGAGKVQTTPVAAHTGSITQVAVQQMPLEIEGPSTEPGLQQYFATMELPNVAQAGSRFVGWRKLSVDGHKSAMLAYDITFEGRPARLRVLVVPELRDGEMTEGDEEQLESGRWIHHYESQGHMIVTYIDAKHNGYMFIADELPPSALIDLVGRTSLVGPQ